MIMFKFHCTLYPFLFAFVLHGLPLDNPGTDITSIDESFIISSCKISPCDTYIFKREIKMKALVWLVGKLSIWDHGTFRAVYSLVDEMK